MSSKEWRPTAFVETTPGGAGEDADPGRAAQRRTLPAFVLRLLSLDTVALVLGVALVEEAFPQPRRCRRSAPGSTGSRSISAPGVRRARSRTGERRRGSRSGLIRGVLAVEATEQRLEADPAEARVADALRRLDGPRDHLLRRQGERAAALRGDLDLAAALEVVHQGERLGDAAAPGEGAVVAQEHHPALAERGDELLPLFGAQARAVVVVVAHLPGVGDAELVDRLQALGLRRDRGAADRVQVHHAARLGARLVDGA